jgi:selenocysteine lyase/cysteine desulfurase
MAWPGWERRIGQIRKLAAGLFGADEGEIAFVPNTTTGIGLVAEGLSWRPGDNVVTPANEFPSNQYPWMNLETRGVETRRIATTDGRLTAEMLLDACDARTRLISVSWVGYATGWRVDVASLVQEAHNRGILVFLDAIQGLGVFPMDAHAWEIDFFAADGHKWMLGPEGAGIVYVRHDQLAELRPLMVGWNSVVQSHDFSRCEFNLRPAASRYEGGSANMVGIAALGASLELLKAHGLSSTTSPIADQITQFNQTAADRLQALGAVIRSPQDPGHTSGILSFEFPGKDPAELRRRCLTRKIALSVRHGWLRISPHAYNDEADLQQLIEVLRAGIKS